MKVGQPVVQVPVKLLYGLPVRGGDLVGPAAHDNPSRETGDPGHGSHPHVSVHSTENLSETKTALWYEVSVFGLKGRFIQPRPSGLGRS